MRESSVDLLAFERGTVTAPAGCGKTHLIAQTLKRHAGSKPLLILTHTNAGVVALRGRFDKAGISPKTYKLSTIDGWALKLIGMFPARSKIDLNVLKLSNPNNDYPAVRDAAWRLLKAGHVQDILASSYARLIVDEYQDCSAAQHAIVYHAAKALPTCILGDPLQAIFGWQGNEPADWSRQVCIHFPIVGELSTPWRWLNAGAPNLGEWLLEVRSQLLNGNSIDLMKAPSEVIRITLGGPDDRVRQLRAARTKAPTNDGSVLIIGKSTSPSSQQEFASQIPGAITVEAVDLRDLVKFARELDFRNPNALQTIATFASSVMTNVGAQDLIRRIGVLKRGKNRKDASEVERAALEFERQRSPGTTANLLMEINKEGGVRSHRPAVLRACMKALQSCSVTEGNSFLDAVIRAREQNRLVGRPLPKRAVGSTLLLKGLEAEVSVILDADDLDARNLYVAMTRGSKRLVVCSRSSTLHPH